MIGWVSFLYEPLFSSVFYLPLIKLCQNAEIRSNVAAYLPEINKLLQNVPRQMLLLLKTNDLLRGIESALQTRASASSFLNMSRCCVRAISM